VRLRKDAKVELIRQVPLFSQLSKAELAEVARLADEVDFNEGKRFMREGQRGSEFFVLLDGSAEVRKGKRKVNELSGRDFFGEIALVTRSPRTATVTATSSGRALVVTDRAFKRLLERSPQIQVKVLQALAERLAPETL
jgi:CRP/FNR family transcriptional regulator, cyclic AMP receptor protein